MTYLMLLIIAIPWPVTAEPLSLGAKSDAINSSLELVARKYNRFENYRQHICGCGKLASMPKLPADQRLVVGIPQTNRDEVLYVVFDTMDLKKLAKCPENNTHKYYTVSKEKIRHRE